ncbi:MAG: adenylate/guanylate cyclase domain-containing protein [Dermatophilaceae bacterium]|nr:adenylate/guanylate cyclase domain-containing protein [Dermatophilaceae bacterium]
MPRAGRRGTDPPEELAGGVWPAADDAEARLLGQRRSMRAREVSAKASVSIRSARKFWHALGFPHVQDDETVFTDADRDALRSMADLVRDGVFDETTALGMTRAFARTTDRLAVWQVQLMAEAIGALPQQVATAEVGSGLETTRAMPDPATARAAAAMLVSIADDLEPLLIYAWRRHLSAAISRMVTDAEPIPDQPGVVRSVGFADLVSFTALVRRLSEHDLARVVQRFEALASDVVTAHGGRVIKTMGDEVLFVAIGARPAAAIALDLVEAMADDDVLPDVRVGMASGRVISRLGDVFGTTVNIASRLTAVAKPGTVVVDDVLATSLASMSGFEMSPLRRRALRGIGPVTPWVLRRADLTARRGMMGLDEAGRAGDDSDDWHGDDRGELGYE